MPNVLFVVAGGFFSLWLLADVLLLAFAAILVAVVLDGLTRPLCRYAPFLPRNFAILAVLLMLMGIIAGAIVVMGLRVQQDLEFLYDQLPNAMDALGTALNIHDLPAVLGDQIISFTSERGLLGSIALYTTAILGGAASLLIVVVAGVFLAARPTLYVEGIAKLFPRERSEQVHDAMVTAGRALRLWLVGQFITMLVIGVATWAGLRLLGVPSAAGLGLMAGILEFVPIVGPILAAVPAVLIGFSEGGTLVYWIIGLYLVIQQLEGAVLIPLIQQRTVSLPPVLGLFAILVFGVLFGPLGVLLATPLTVVIYVLVKRLYVRDYLGWDVTIPGEDPRSVKGAASPSPRGGPGGN